MSKTFKKFKEDILIPIKIGDTIKTGKFKNKSTVVKKIGKNDKGDITVNDKPLLKVRLIKDAAKRVRKKLTPRSPEVKLGIFTKVIKKIKKDFVGPADEGRDYKKEYKNSNLHQNA